MIRAGMQLCSNAYRQVFAGALHCPNCKGESMIQEDVSMAPSLTDDTVCTVNNAMLLLCNHWLNHISFDDVRPYPLNRLLRISYQKIHVRNYVSVSVQIKLFHLQFCFKLMTRTKLISYLCLRVEFENGFKMKTNSLKFQLLFSV